MWNSAIQSSTQLVTDALLHRPVLPRDARAFEKVSGAIAVRTALQGRTSEQTLMFFVPEANARTARYVTAALLVGEHAHRCAGAELPLEEARRLFRGDVLLVTQAVSDSKNQLDEFPIGRSQKLSDVWKVTPLSKYSAQSCEKPRVFLANPGWLVKGTAGKRFGVVVIDASHPRTFAQLPDLVRVARGCSSLRFIISPPPSDVVLSACGYPGKTSVWTWNPQAQRDAQAIVEVDDLELPMNGDRFLWVCDSDSETAEVLAGLHRRLVAAVKAAAGHPYPGLKQCWSIYNRLRQLVVPLAQLEQMAALTWAGSLRARIDELKSVEGHGNIAWDTTWPALVEATKVAYEMLLKREETAKFWALSSSVEAFLTSSAEHLRIVVGSESEVDLLVALLGQLVDGFTTAMTDGRIECVTASQDGRLIAEGQLAPTILLGPRNQAHRYLDVFPSRRIDEFLYPHEVQIEQAAQTRLYGQWTRSMTDECRVALLKPLGFRALPKSTPKATEPRPSVTVQSPGGHKVKLVFDSLSSPELDVEGLSANPSLDAFFSTTSGHYPGPSPNGGDVVEVISTKGGIHTFYATQNVDVFFSETGVVQKHPARSLKSGWQVISFVDGRYDGLFQRLTEVVNSRLAPKERVAVELWRKSKLDIARRCQDRRALYDRLQAKGLAANFEALMTWLRDSDSGVIAPQQFSDFKLLASESAIYKSQELLMAAFNAVQHQRGRNRAAGRKLKQFLRAVVSGDGYDDALASAQKLDTALGDVLAAVEVLEVVSIRIIKKEP